jgi:hypothetical protein
VGGAVVVLQVWQLAAGDALVDAGRRLTSERIEHTAIDQAAVERNEHRVGPRRLEEQGAYSDWTLSDATNMSHVQRKHAAFGKRALASRKKASS